MYVKQCFVLCLQSRPTGTTAWFCEQCNALKHEQQRGHYYINHSTKSEVQCDVCLHQDIVIDDFIDHMFSMHDVQVTSGIRRLRSHVSPIARRAAGGTVVTSLCGVTSTATDQLTRRRPLRPTWLLPRAHLLCVRPRRRPCHCHVCRRRLVLASTCPFQE